MSGRIATVDNLRHRHIVILYFGHVLSKVELEMADYHIIHCLSVFSEDLAFHLIEVCGSIGLSRKQSRIPKFHGCSFQTLLLVIFFRGSLSLLLHGLFARR